MMHNGERRLGIDIGRVIISAGSAQAGPDTSFVGGSLENALKTPPVDGALDVIPRLVRAFAGNVWLVSKAGSETEALTRAWLKHYHFFQTTGILADNVRFCRKRRDKAEHCSELKITHFIDDRLQVLQLLQGIVPHLYHFGASESHSKVFVAVTGWKELENIILSSGS